MSKICRPIRTDLQTNVHVDASWCPTAKTWTKHEQYEASLAFRLVTCAGKAGLLEMGRPSHTNHVQTTSVRATAASEGEWCVTELSGTQSTTLLQQSATVHACCQLQPPLTNVTPMQIL